MAKPKENGGLGLRDIRMMAAVATIKRTLSIWSSDQSLWVTWMREKYVKERALNQIGFTSSQSPIWSSILWTTHLTKRCATCGPNYSLIWKGKGVIPNSQAIYESICLPSHKHPLVEGIWLTKSSKMATTLWWICWNRLHTFDRLRSWRIAIPNVCCLCGKADEMPNHLFIKCDFTKHTWLRFIELTRSALWRVMQRIVLSTEDLGIWEVIKGIQWFKWCIPCWGLHWIALSTFVWQVLIS